ncbi:hypothetical protein HK105_209069 [Polyrhizophydium stewartii]|uniref:Ankyrin repeat protein n=1 Tax=Polyrhizophydium stewartii TaxID=2732419 RepID=A0ABR4MW09_9FUNG
MADIRTNDAPAAALAAPPPPAQPAAAHADPAAATAQHDRPAERLDGQPTLPPAGPPHLAAASASTTSQPPPSTTSDAARAVRFRPDATNEWDRMPAEIQNMILSHSSPFTKFVNGLLLAAELRVLPQRLRDQVWQDASDTDWQGDVELLPWVSLSSPTLSLTNRRLFERARPRFDYEDIAAIAVRNGWDDLLDFDEAKDLGVAAACQGKLSLLEELIDVRKADICKAWLVELAAEHGHLECVEYLHRRIPDAEWTQHLGRSAAKGGNLDIVIWLKEHRPACLGVPMISGAVGQNHLHIVRWLADNTDIVVDISLLDYGGEIASFEMLQLMLECFPTLFDGQADGRRFRSSDQRVIEFLDQRNRANLSGLVNDCCREGKIDLLDWALTHFQLSFGEFELYHAYIRDQSKLIKWAYERGVPFTSVSADNAAGLCNTDIIGWAIVRDRRLIPMLVSATTRRGDWRLVEWWRVRHGVVFGQRELEKAIKYRNDKLAAHLLEMDEIEWDLDAARLAADKANQHQHGGSADDDDQTSDGQSMDQDDLDDGGNDEDGDGDIDADDDDEGDGEDMAGSESEEADADSASDDMSPLGIIRTAIAAAAARRASRSR